MQSDLLGLSDQQLFERTALLVRHERRITADILRHLMEIESRRLLSRRACASAYGYLRELGYSDGAALKRSRVAKLALRLPQVLDELEGQRQHMTGLFRLSNYLTADNVDSMLSAARGLKCNEIDELIARRFPKSDVPDLIAEIVEDPALSLPGTTCPKVGNDAPADAADSRDSAQPEAAADGSHESDASQPSLPAVTYPAAGPDRIRPLSAKRYLIQLTVGPEFVAQLERARELKSHAIPSGSLPAILGCALRELVQRAEKRLMGTGKPCKSRKQEPDPESRKQEPDPKSRYIPVEVQRAVRERDGHRCTFVDEQGRRCEARRFLTVEHIHPHGRRGPTNPENCCLLCSTHKSPKRPRRLRRRAHRQENRRPARAHLSQSQRPTGQGAPRPDELGLQAPRGGHRPGHRPRALPGRHRSVHLDQSRPPILPPTPLTGAVSGHR